MSDEEKEQLDDDLVDEQVIKADPKQELIRIDKFLMNRVDSVSRNKVQNAIRAGSITVNDENVKPNYRIRPGDLIKVIIPKASDDYTLEAEDIPLDVVYEDDEVLVINKPSGLVVHPGISNYNGTLVNALLYHYQNLPSRDSEVPRPGIVHRLDKNTSGLMVVAKTDYSMSFLAKLFFKRDIKRSYHALVWGNPEEDEGRIEANIGRHERFHKKMDTFPEGDKGKEAITNYKVIQRFGYVTLVECRLETGRTHQIRVHMKHIGHPVFNDEMYGGDRIVKGTVYSKYKQFVQNCFSICSRQALHAKSLGFEHPTTKQPLFFESHLPKDMQDLVDKWDKYTSHIKEY